MATFTATKGKRLTEEDFIDMCGGKYGYDGRINRIREMEFSRLKDVVYLDHTGTTLYPQSLLNRVYDDLAKNVYGNPHSKNSSSQLVTDIIDQVRGRILKHFNTTSESHSVIFTAGATAALKLLADNFDWQVMNNRQSRHENCFCYLQENHTSVIGIRERAALDGARILCVTEEDLRRRFESIINGTDARSLSNQKSTKDTNGTMDDSVKENSSSCHSLFAFPAMCNLSGRKYPLEWVGQVQNGCLADCDPLCHWFVLLDAASFVSTSSLDLSSCTADFVPVSFYKIFGFPTGLGALIVKNSSSFVFRKSYYGGGTVQATISSERFHALKTSIADRFEDGTVSFLDIISLHHAFDTFEKLTGTMMSVAEHTYSIASFVYKEMRVLQHNSGKPLCKIYCETDFKDRKVQGPAINFNVLRANGEYVGYSEVEKMASLYNIHLRTGCFCNTGACQRYLGLSNSQVKENLSAGHVCGDDVDLIEGKPTGSVRISFGYMSNFADAQTFLDFLKECFLMSEKHDDSSHNNSCIVHSRPTEIAPESAATNSCVVNGLPDNDPRAENSSVLRTLNDPGVGVKHTNNTEINGMQLEHEPNATSSSALDGPTALTRRICELQRTSNSEKNSESENCSSVVSSDMSLDKICLYPVKSCAAFEVLEWEVGPRGFAYDRHWMIITESGASLNQKREPRLCLIKPLLDLSSNILSLTAPGMSTLVLPLRTPSESQAVCCQANLCNTKVCGDRVSAWDCGEEAALWVTSFLNKNCRLIEHHKQDGRTSKLGGNREGIGASSLSLANESQFLLVSRESTVQLLTCIAGAPKEGNTCLTSREKQSLLIEEAVDVDKLVDRFRANLVIRGGNSPFTEDTWKTVKIGNLLFEGQGKCNRCQMVCVDQETGERSAEPMKTLGRLRGSRMPFGIHLVHVPTGSEPFILHRGDVVTASMD